MIPITPVPTLAEVVLRLQQDPSLTSSRRRDLVSAIQRMSEMTGVDARSTPASMQFMRPLIKAVRPAKYDLTPKTWSNLRSNFRAALVDPAPSVPNDLDPQWSALRAGLRNKPKFTRLGLSRLISFCNKTGIAPNAVCDAVSDRFRSYLETDTQVDPHACHRTACRLWNQAVETVPGWPPVLLSVPGHRKPRQSVPITSFPLSLQQEFAAYIASLRNYPFETGSLMDLFDDAAQRALAASTVRQRAAELGLALSALVASGKDSAEITSLACLVEPDAFKAILRRYLKDDGKPRPFAYNMAHTLMSLAKRWVKPDPAVLEKLKNLQGRLPRQRKCLTEKNRSVLRTLDDPVVRARLYFLPDRMANWAERTTPVNGAMAMQTSVAIAILLSAPLRIANLAGLRLDRHLVRPGGPRSLWQLDIPAHEVKNDQALVYELPQQTTTLIDRYIRRLRPSLAAAGNPYLFPVESRHKNPHGMSQQIRVAIANWVGIDMTPHQFRHFAARIIKQRSRGDRRGADGTIADLLGHKSLETARAFYSEIDTLSAGRQFDEFLEAERDKARLPGRGRS
jgi:integrase